MASGAGAGLGEEFLAPAPVDMERRRAEEEERQRRVRKRRAEVLEEDTWVAQLEAIIERDYFPEIPKLQSKLEWLRAVNSGDEGRIMRAQRNNALRRAGVRTPLDLETPGGEGGGAGASASSSKEWSTPLRAEGASEWDETALLRERRLSGRDLGSTLAESEAEEASAAGEALAAAPALSLDQFCRRFTSEDNESFEEILERANAKVREKRDGLFKTVERLESGREGACSTDGYGTSGQRSGALIGWKQDPINPLFFPSQIGSVPVSEKERKDLYVKGPGRAIAAANTRLPSSEERAGGVARGDLDSPSTSASASVQATPERGAGWRGGGYVEAAGWAARGADDLRGYRYVLSPTPTPTSGEGGPVFKIRPDSERERLARDLGSKSAAGGSSVFRSKGKKGGALRRALRMTTTPSPSIMGTPTLSPAGRRLAARAGKSTSRLAKELRASYTTPTPTRRSEF